MMIVFWRVARSFLREECPRSRSHLAAMRGLANALIPPPKGRGGRTPLDGKIWVARRSPRQMSASDTQIFRESDPQFVYEPEHEASLL